MKIRTLALPRNSSLLFTIGAIAIVASVFILNVFLAQAVEGPEVSTTIHTQGGATTTEAAIGSVVYARAFVASTTATTTLPTGTVNFNLYNNTSCLGIPTVQASVALVNGVATSSTTTVPITGLSYRVAYNGDATSTPSQGVCTALVATAPNPVLTTTLSTTTALAGTFVYDTAVLGSTTSNASGTVAYTVYTNNSCNTGAQTAGVKTVTNGTVPASDSVQFNTPGTYYWQAVYSGDAHNAAATSTCTSEILHILATSTPVARIIVDKVTVPSGATTTFNFDVSGSLYSDFSLTDASTPNDQILAPGTYRIIEDRERGWKLTSVLCSRNGATSTTYVPGAAINLAAGDTVSCTFTNTATTTKDKDNKHDDDDKDHEDKGKHKGFIWDLPFGILKKVFNNLPIPPGIERKWGDRVEEAHNKFNDDDDKENDDDFSSSSIEERLDKMKENVFGKWEEKEKKEKKNDD